MIPVYVPCRDCLGNGHVRVPGKTFELGAIVRCRSCDGLGRQWAPGAPAYGCEVTLADREPGEVVTLGNGQRAKILWHQPRKRKGVVVETTFIDLLEDGFFERETFKPVPYPSCVGVASVDEARPQSDREAHDRERVEDANDPMQRRGGALL